MRSRFNIVVLAAILAGFPVASGARAQSSDGFPFSIMTPDGSERRARQRVRQVPPQQVRPAETQTNAQPRRRVRGSSTASTIPTYRSPLTPLGKVRPMPTAPSMAYPSSPATTVPGIGGVAGTPAIAPARPAGQSFQDRARNCVMSGSAQGVGAGQIGSFTQNCVNR